MSRRGQIAFAARVVVVVVVEGALFAAPVATYLLPRFSEQERKHGSQIGVVRLVGVAMGRERGHLLFGEYVTLFFHVGLVDSDFALVLVLALSFLVVAQPLIRASTR